MNMKLTIAAAVAAVTLFATAGSAFAVTGVATGAVNVREGAGTGYDIIGHLSKGEYVEIFECGGGWCETDEGYVSASYLAVVDYDDDDYDYDDHDDYDDYDDVDVEVCFGGGGFGGGGFGYGSFCIEN